uniref:Uncharacterized protein n=1 Tax=Nothobranchius furzeri TaxID=105023 RepID=A0A8C6VYQ6_NOTFU
MGCCRKTSPHHWSPGTSAPYRSCRWRRRATIFFTLDPSGAKQGNSLSISLTSQTYSIRLFVRIDAGLPSRCKVTVDLEGIPRAALVWIDPVLCITCHYDQSKLNFLFI